MKTRHLQFERLERRDLMSADLWPQRIGLAADVFVHGGAYLTGNSLSRPAALAGLTRETLLSDSATRAVIAGNANDLNGALLYPDGQARVGQIFWNGGKAALSGSAIGAAGRQNVRDFVNAGGSFTGSCAGAFVIGVYSSTTLHLWNGRMGSYSGSSTQTVSFAAEPEHPIAKFLSANGVTSLRVPSLPNIGGPRFSEGYRHPDGTVFSGEIVAGRAAGTPAIIEYRPTPESGLIVVQPNHPEYGRQRSHTVLMAAILAYADSENRVTPEVKGELTYGQSVSMVDKIGDGQYHRYLLEVTPETRELRLSTDNIIGTELFVTYNGVAYNGGADYSGDEIVISSPEPGEWEVSVLGTHNIKNGVNYTVTVSATVWTGPVWEDIPITPGMNLHQNPIQKHDVNGDGEVTLLDAMVIVNAINQNGMGSLPEIVIWPTICVDVTGDGILDAMDVFSILDQLYMMF